MLALIRLLSYLLVVALLCGCGGFSGRMTTPPTVVVTPAPAHAVTATDVESARAQLKELQCPVGCDDSAFDELKSALDQFLTAEPAKGVSEIADQERNTVADAQVV